PASLNSTDRYVAANGSDSNDGSACHPWATVEYAASLAQPGWTVHVGPGTYSVGSGIVNNNSGNSSARIVYIGSYDKSAWTWNTKLVSTGTAVWTTDANYLDIVGFDLTSTNTSATWGFHTGGSYIHIKDNYVHDIYSDLPGAGIMVGGGSTTTGVEVNGNLVARVAHTSGGNTDNQCIYTTESHVTIVNNIVFGCHKYGIQLYSSIAGGNTYNVVANNTVFGSYNGIVVGGETGSGTPTVDYNTITNNIVYGVTNYGLHASGIFGSHNITSNNLTYNNGSNYSSSYTNHTNDILRDPLFVNYLSDGTGNYQLQPASPCVDAGTSLGAPAYDFLDITRPQGSSVDCGAYEYVP
ncbi:MAG: choice-of-anchor Q domain-containing protein, partial [Bacteroidota bacterium]|nr:choice-of-anchor Q domain-containing protein [Bacteroidota bacterium]